MPRRVIKRGIQTGDKMNNVFYQHKVFTHKGTVVTISGLRKSLNNGEDVRILALYPSGIIAPAKVKAVEPIKERNTMWHVKGATGRSIHAGLTTKLLTPTGWRAIDALVPEETYLRVGPSAKHSMDGVQFALSGVLRQENNPDEKVGVVNVARVEHVQSSVYSWNGDNYAMSITMSDVDNFIITSGIIVKSNGDN